MYTHVCMYVSMYVCTQLRMYDTVLVMVKLLEKQVQDCYMGSRQVTVIWGPDRLQHGEEGGGKIKSLVTNQDTELKIFNFLDLS